MNDTIDQFLFANNRETDSKGETNFSCLEVYLITHNVPLRNITAADTDGAPSMVGRYNGFSVSQGNCVYCIYCSSFPIQAACCS